jgi:TonB family protein
MTSRIPDGSFHIRPSSLVLAVLAEVFLGFLIWIWLGTIRTPESRLTGQLLATMRISPEKRQPPPKKIPQREKSPQVTAAPRFNPPEARLPSLSPLMGIRRQMPKPSVSGIMQPLSLTFRGAWQGSAGQGFWVDVPIPGTGGLPASPFSITQLHYDCGKTYTSGRSGYVWVEGRVNRRGRVTSSRILQYSTNRAPAVESVRMIRKWRFAPLRVNGRLIWFRIVVNVLWGWYPHQSSRRQRPLYAENRITRCRPMEYFPHAWFNGVMPHWLLYRLRGHHPLAILLATGRNPVPGIAQAVRFVLWRLQERQHG